MKRILLSLLALVLAGAMLAGCGLGALMPLWLTPGGDGKSGAIPSMPQLPYEGTPTPFDEFGTGEANQQGKTGAYGSVGLVGFPSVLISVYLDEKDGRSWDDEMIAHSRQNLACAMDWLVAQAGQYNATPRISYDDGSRDDLFYHIDYDGTFVGGEDSDEEDGFFDEMDSLCEKLDTAALEEKYGTSSVGVLVFLPLEGSSFTMVHYADDEYFYEYSCLYAYDAYAPTQTFDSPAVYAHEILHLYGAADLYEGSTDYFVDDELTDYVAQTWPDDVMLGIDMAADTLPTDEIPYSICPLTAYCLGLCTGFDGLEKFPTMRRLRPGIFNQGTKAYAFGTTPWDLAEDGEAV